MDELTEPERIEMGLIKGNIRLDFSDGKNQRRIMLYYTRSMDVQDIVELENGFATISHEYIQGLLLKYSETYIEGTMLPEKFWTVVIISGSILLILIMVASLYLRKRYVKKLEEKRNKLPGLNEFRKFCVEFIGEKNYVNYALVRMSFGHDKIRRMYSYQEADESFKQIVATLKTYIVGENEVIVDAGNHELLLLLHCTDENRLMERVHQMQAEIEKDFMLLQKEYFLEIHAGAYRLSGDDAGIEDAEKKCEIAYRYACSNLESYVLYDKNAHQKVLAEYEMELEVERALENHEFTIYLQPLVELKTGKVKGAETFVRWKHPNRGMLAPGDFLGIMKRKHLLGSMNMDVYRQGCRVLREEALKGRELCMLFHFTLDNVEDKNFAENLEAVAEQYGINRQQILVQMDEILDFGYESVLQENTSKLKSFGFRVYLDGLELERAFLQYLQGNIDGVKFRYGVIKHLDKQGAKETFAKAVNLCQSMNLEMICAGVENGVQKQIVSELQCAMASGFYFYYPMEADVFHETIEKQENSAKKGIDTAGNV